MIRMILFFYDGGGRGSAAGITIRYNRSLEWVRRYSYLWSIAMILKRYMVGLPKTMVLLEYRE